MVTVTRAMLRKEGVPQSPLRLASSQPAHLSNKDLAKCCSKEKFLLLEWYLGGGAEPTCGVQGAESTDYKRMGDPTLPFLSLLSKALASARPKAGPGLLLSSRCPYFSHTGWSRWGRSPHTSVPPSSLRQGHRGGPSSPGSDTPWG